MLLLQFNNIETAARFFQVCIELNADTETERLEILKDFVEYGEITRIQQTQRTKEQLLKDWSKEYSILDITSKSQ